jgi:hypothetical protein
VRYYDIQLFKPGSSAVFKEWTSFPQVGASKQADPGALNVLIDAYVNALAQPQSLGSIQLWGISLQDVAQANNFTNCNINVYAGFQAGLPLNNPSQAGLILSGYVFQSFANWQGTDMTLDFVIATQGNVASQNTNVALSWAAGTPLAEALTATLKTALPNIKPNIQINSNLVLAHDESGVYPSLVSFAQALKPITQDAIGGTYPGVDIVLTPDSISVYDGTTQTAPKQIAFQDLMGQPTWIDNQTIQFVSPMRSDLHLSDYIKMPQGLLGVPGAVVTTASSQPQARQQSVFNGTFMVSLVHQLGNFRQADGQSWVTITNAVAQAAS